MENHPETMSTLTRYTLCLLPLAAVCFLASCQKTQTASAEQQATAAQYGENPFDPEINGPLDGSGGLAAASASSSSSASSNRFGFAGSTEDEAPVQPLRRDTQVYAANEPAPAPKPRVEKREETAPPPAPRQPDRFREELARAPLEEVEKKEPEAPKPAEGDPMIVKLGFADAIPGDRLHVRLPGEYASLGPISVERMDASGNTLGTPWSRGTQMQIRNPQVPGGKIYFKVP